MAHFAKVNQGRVINVIVAEQDFIDNLLETEPGEWIQTSYNTHGGVHYTYDENDQPIPSEDQSKALRYNFACMHGYYDSAADAFYDLQPYKGFVLNTDTYLWEPPIPYPGDEDNRYTWNEETQSWDAVESE